VSPQLAPALLGRRARVTALREKLPGLSELTPAEQRVLRLIAEGRTSRDIAELLALSVRTVENHRAAITSKLGLAGVNALLRFALEHRSELS